MRVPESRRRSEIGFNMTPMIDVVFLLIIFFLVASHFGQQESAIEVDIPQAAGGEAITDSDKPRVTVSIPEPGQLFVGSQARSVADLEMIFIAEKNRMGDAFQLRVRAGKRVPFREVEPVLKAAAKAGIRDVQFGITGVNR